MAATAAGEAEAVDFEPEDDDLMEEDLVPEDTTTTAPLPKLKSAITGGGSGSSSGPKKTKGRGFVQGTDVERDSRLSGRGFESLGSDGGPGPLRSIEGWIILVTGVHEEAQEDDLLNAFGDFGAIKNLHLNLDRRTGFVKGYALIEYEEFSETQEAISKMDGTQLLDQIINVNWAFCKGPYHKKNTRRRSRSPRRRF